MFRLGLRYDRFQQKAGEELVYSSTISDTNRQVDHLLGGHISANYFISDAVMLFLGAGRSYRTPTATERYIQGNPSFFGNPNLQPTANTECDLGVKYRLRRWKFQAKVFYSFLDDYIYQEYHPDGYRSYTNIDAHMYGGDITAGVDLLTSLTLEAALAYQRGRKDTYPENNSDADLGQISPLKGRLALKYNKERPFGQQNAGLYGTIEWVHSNSASRKDTDVGEKQLAAWDIMNLRVGYRYQNISLNVGIDNVFDREYAVANSYEWDVISGTGATPAIVNEPGRFFYASLGYQW